MLPLVADMTESSEAACLPGSSTHYAPVCVRTPACGGEQRAALQWENQLGSVAPAFLTSAALADVTPEPALDHVNMGSTSASAGPTRPPAHHMCRVTQHGTPRQPLGTCITDSPRREARATPRQRAPARDKHAGFLKGRPTGIQFFVLPKEIIVHLIICSFEIINIWLVGCWSWELHVCSCSEGPDAESPFAETHKERTKSQLD